MLLESLSYPEVELYLNEKDIILVPVGSWNNTVRMA